jgi:hypothetical protein
VKVVILKIAADGSRIPLAYFEEGDLESAQDRLTNYGDPGTVEAKEVSEEEIREMNKKNRERRESWIREGR